MNKIIDLIRVDLRDLNPYSSARDEAKLGKVWLNANESPYPVLLQDGTSVNRYPEKQPTQLKKLLAEIYQVNVDQIVLSRGSDEVIDLLIRLFCRAEKDAIMICSPTFGMYAVYARIQGAKVIDVPLKKSQDYQLDCDALVARWTPEVKIIFLCTPNNPTGNNLNKEDIIQLCTSLRDKCLIVVDEAYVEFSDMESLTSCINQYANLVVLRTLSKAYGLAGARCGALLAQAELVPWILKIISPYPMPSPVMQVVVQRLISDLKQIQQQVVIIKAERIRLAAAFKKMPFIIKVFPSAANFLLIETTDAQAVMKHCAEKGIVLRNMHDKPGLQNCVRISIGLPAENDQLIEVLNNI